MIFTAIGAGIGALASAGAATAGAGAAAAGTGAALGALGNTATQGILGQLGSAVSQGATEDSFGHMLGKGLTTLDRINQAIPKISIRSNGGNQFSFGRSSSERMLQSVLGDVIGPRKTRNTDMQERAGLTTYDPTMRPMYV